jgi:hypothetical protein
MDLLANKKHDNAAGYVISMWHLEDLLRANELDLHRVVEQLVEPMEADPHTKAAVATWYAGVMDRMRAEDIVNRGHLAEVEEVVNELEFLHRSLVEVVSDGAYEELLALAEPAIRELQGLAVEDALGTVETGLTAIYGVMVLRATDKKVSAATAEAERHIRAMLDRLSLHYKQMRKLPGVSLN